MTPDRLLRWYRRLIAKKYDGSQARRSGRPKTDIAAHRPWIPALEAPEEVLDGIYVVEVYGSLFFGNAGPLQRKLGGLKQARAIVIHMGNVRYMDQSGVYALADLVRELNEADTQIYIAQLNPEPRDVLARLGVAPGAVPRDHGPVRESAG